MRLNKVQIREGIKLLTGRNGGRGFGRSRISITNMLTAGAENGIISLPHLTAALLSAVEEATEDDEPNVELITTAVESALDNAIDGEEIGALIPVAIPLKGALLEMTTDLGIRLIAPGIAQRLVKNGANLRLWLESVGFDVEAAEDLD